MNKLLISLMICVLLAGCGGVTPIVPTPAATLTATPTKTSTSTITPSPTITPTPIPPIEATWAAFETVKANVCPTATPSTASGANRSVLADSDILREFAGIYSMYVGLSSGMLILNCDGTYVESDFSDGGGLHVRNGTVSVQSGRIKVGFSRVFIPVRWDQRRYLVNTELVTQFCEDMKSKGSFREPRGEGDLGLAYLRGGDGYIVVNGVPVAPSGMRICS